MALQFLNPQYAFAPNPTSLDLLGACSFMAWVMPYSFISFNTILSRQIGTGFDETLWLGLDGTARLVSFGAFTGTSSGGIFSTSTLSAFSWTHCAQTWDGAVRRLYINGAVEPAVGTATGTYQATSRELVIAANNNGAAFAPNEFFNGQLEDVRIYNRGLGPDEIRTIYQSKGKDAINSGLLCRYPFVETPPNQVATTLANIIDQPSLNLAPPVSSPLGMEAYTSPRKNPRISIGA